MLIVVHTSEVVSGTLVVVVGEDVEVGLGVGDGEGPGCGFGDGTGDGVGEGVGDGVGFDGADALNESKWLEPACAKACASRTLSMQNSITANIRISRRISSILMCK